MAGGVWHREKEREERSVCVKNGLKKKFWVYILREGLKVVKRKSVGGVV